MIAARISPITAITIKSLYPLIGISVSAGPGERQHVGSGCYHAILAGPEHEFNTQLAKTCHFFLFDFRPRGPALVGSVPTVLSPGRFGSGAMPGPTRPPLLRFSAGVPPIAPPEGPANGGPFSIGLATSGRGSASGS